LRDDGYALLNDWPCTSLSIISPQNTH